MPIFSIEVQYLEIYRDNGKISPFFSAGFFLIYICTDILKTKNQTKIFLRFLDLDQLNYSQLSSELADVCIYLGMWQRLYFGNVLAMESTIWQWN